MITLTFQKPLPDHVTQNVVRFIASRQRDGYTVSVSGDDRSIKIVAAKPAQGYRRFLKDFMESTNDRA